VRKALQTAGKAGCQAGKAKHARTHARAYTSKSEQAKGVAAVAAPFCTAPTDRPSECCGVARICHPTGSLCAPDVLPTAYLLLLFFFYLGVASQIPSTLAPSTPGHHHHHPLPLLLSPSLPAASLVEPALIGARRITRATAYRILTENEVSHF
jgi:hypothetical protein